jgi:uncharacterized protein (TIGR02996 family)
VDRVVAARKLIGDLVKDEQIEVRRVEIVGRDLAKLCETLKRAPSGQELGEWLEEHPQVTELSASTSLLEELILRHLAEPEAPVTAARNAALERQIREAPDQVGLYQVYADWLQEHADPLGELIALGVASASGGEDEVARFDRHLKRHEAYLLGGIASQLVGRIQLRWRYGLVQAIEEVGDPITPQLFTQLLGLRVCELVEAISLRTACTAELDAAIAEAAPDSMRTLTLGLSLGTLPRALLQRPLRSLSISGSYELVIDAHTFPPSLDRLELRVRGLSSIIPVELGVRDLEVLATSTALSFLTQAILPRLERLTLDVGVATPAAMLAFLEAHPLPALTSLGLRNGLLAPSTFSALAKLPIAARLRSLSLVELGLTDPTFAALASTEGFALTELDVSYNELSPKGLEAARALAPNVISTRQHRRGHTMERRVRKLAGTRLSAAESIADPKAWRRAGVDGDVRWARYRGEAEYELFITSDLSRHGCSCPSEIRPCKHVIALALIAERTPLPAAPSHGIETRVASGAGLADLLRASLDDEP